MHAFSYLCWVSLREELGVRSKKQLRRRSGKLCKTKFGRVWSKNQNQTVFLCLVCQGTGAPLNPRALFLLCDLPAHSLLLFLFCFVFPALLLTGLPLSSVCTAFLFHNDDWTLWLHNIISYLEWCIKGNKQNTPICCGFRSASQDAGKLRPSIAWAATLWCLYLILTVQFKLIMEFFMMT